MIVETRVERPTVPPALLDCLPAPAPPGPGFTQRDVGLFLIDALQAGEDCRAKLARVKSFLQEK